MGDKADTAGHPGLEQLYEIMAAQNLAPLWDVYENLVVPEPFKAEPSFGWSWNETLPAIEEAGDKVKGHLADHRVLLLKNPGLEDRVATTTNIIVGIQCVMPGEQTVEHRHTPSACRVILEGEGGGTFVDGVRCDMCDGDLILTPNWTWHNHHNDTNARAVWVDVLDVPLVGCLDAVFGARPTIIPTTSPSWLTKPSRRAASCPKLRAPIRPIHRVSGIPGPRSLKASRRCRRRQMDRGHSGTLIP